MNPTEAYRAEIKPWSLVFLALALVAETAHALIFGSPLFWSLLRDAQGVDRLVVQLTFPLAAVAIFLFCAGWLPGSRRHHLLALALGAVLAAGLFWVDNKKYHLAFIPYLLTIPLGVWLCLRALWTWLRRRQAGDAARADASTFFWVLVGTASMAFATNALLRAASIIYPLTYDAHLLKIDAAFGNPTYWIASYANLAPDWLKTATTVVYAALAALFFPLVALLIRERKVRSLHGWRTMVIPFMVATVCYAWLPATGPIAAFGGVDFPAGIASPADVPAAMLSVQAAARNAMPSMHLSGAIWVLMIAAAFRRKIFFALSVLFLAGTAWATMALGEHYLIDLVVALPFAAALGLWLMQPPRWRQAPRWAHALQWAAGASFVLWMALLRFAPVWLQGHLGFVQVFSVWSVAVGLVLVGLHVRGVWREADTDEALLRQAASPWAPAAFVPAGLLPAELRGRGWLVGIFFFSGLAGLVYEVVYAKALGVTFGGTALAANTVLMTYMGGMALGAWWGGMLAERSRRPLVLYAWFEAAIGLYAAVTPLLFSGIQALYVMLATDSPPDAGWLTALRMGLGAVVLGVPTVLMGATLPLVFQCLRAMGIPTGRAIAPLYGANVLGAAVGALFGGYALLPAVGRDGATYLAAVISLMVALYVIDRIKREGEPAVVAPAPAGGAPAEAAMPVPSARQGLGALAVLGIGGVVTLALEVVFMHLLAVVAGNSVYAFGLMLATFLAGLALGSGVGERLMRRMDRVSLVTWAQCGIAMSILVTAFVWDGLADYMGSFAYVQRQGIHLDFATRELIRALVCAVAMMPPAFFVGMSYPAAMGVAADWLAAVRFNGAAARGVGLASAINTLGNIGGVLLAGFWWLPVYGSRNVLFGLAVVAVLLAAMMAWAGSAPAQRRVLAWRWSPVGAMAVALALFPAQWNFNSLSQGGNVYFYPQQWGEVMDHAESVEGGLTTVTQSGESHLTLLTNGKFQGNNAEGGEMVAQESIALIPLMHTTQRDKALVIGYGTGMTARVLQDQGYSTLDVVELSRDIVTMADKYFANINAHISDHPSVKMHYTDGRNYLLTQSRQYDLISLEISSIWFAGAANLYNREFYELANRRLGDQGVLQQWVQLHHMRPMDFLYILGSVRSVFKNVWVYVSGGQGIVVASNSGGAASNEAALGKLMGSHTISALKLPELPNTLVAGPAQVDALIQRFDPRMQFFISTDKNLYLEYATPKGNAVTMDTTPILIGMLKGQL